MPLRHGRHDQHNVANATFTNATALTTTSPDENIVIWQSALWAILALALNAMTQPSSADPSPTPAISFAAITVSPPPTHSAKHRATRPDDTTPRAAAFSPSVSVIFFILGPLPQAVKLAGMSNVYNTKIIGFIFLIAYLLGVYEADAVRRATRRHTDKSWLSLAVSAPRIPAHVRDRLAKLADSACTFIIVTSLVVWFVIARVVVCTSRDAGKGMDRYMESIVLLCYYQYPIMFVAVPAGLCGKWYLGQWLLRRFSVDMQPQRMRPVLHASLLYGPAVLSSFSASALSIYLFHTLKNLSSSEQEVRLGWKAYTDTKASLFTLLTYLLVLFVLGIFIPLLTYGLFLGNVLLDAMIGFEAGLEKWNEMKAEKDTAKFLYRIVVPGFTAFNLAFTVLTYAYIYDAEGTSKPG
ncbi:hypothetical protein V502_05486 [Pseudogymnoascus sp. VKM F-4520 (FW-2644)]|nr:hypothetical protein V502_05486 [Pseudogymnoascus sp. VKM F-4520 (FW-2644)]